MQIQKWGLNFSLQPLLLSCPLSPFFLPFSQRGGRNIVFERFFILCWYRLEEKDMFHSISSLFALFILSPCRLLLWLWPIINKPLCQISDLIWIYQEDTLEMVCFTRDFLRLSYTFLKQFLQYDLTFILGHSNIFLKYIKGVKFYTVYYR